MITKHVKALWASPWFWIAAVAVTVVALPFTAGMSAGAFIGMVALRLLLLWGLLRT